MSSGSSDEFNADVSTSESTIGSGTTALVAADMVTPGHTALTRMFRDPSSWAIVLVWRMIIHFVMP